MKRVLLSALLTLGLISSMAPAHSESEILLRTSAEHSAGYDRSLFKLWIDADKNGCDTRKEVLISEAIVKPRIGAKCVLTGGKWISPYDGKSYSKDTGLDIDHVVPLAEAWRSGAWAWTAKQRQDFANELVEVRSLVAVTASVNRSKGDQDLKTWLPLKGKCTYIEAWVATKVRYSLTFDTGELAIVQQYFTSCPITNINVDVLQGYETVANQLAPSASPTPSPSISKTPSASPTPTASASPTSVPSVSPTPTQVLTPTPTPTVSTGSSTPISNITPGAFCTPAGAVGTSSKGVLYTCKTSATDSRNRWRQ